MKDFNKTLNEQLDSLPMSGEIQSKLDLVSEISKELESAKERVAELKMELRNAIEDYNVELAGALRKRIPKVGINLNNGRCSASYKSTNLSCYPDLGAKTWVFDPNPHGRRFTRGNADTLRLDDPIDVLSDAIVQYFSRYKTLR